MPSSTARLAVFDLDGTLAATNDVDNECYLVAVEAVLGCTLGHVDWGAAPHVTDAGIVRWLWQRIHSRDPGRRELDAVQHHFLNELETQRAIAPARFAPITGAANALMSLEASGWSVAIATGGWSKSARLKLAAAEIDLGTIAFASSDDAISRADIVRTAVARAAVATPAGFRRIVSVGDAPWDVACARELGYAFVGIGADGTTAMRAAGATTVLADYSDWDTFVAALNAASVPGFNTAGRSPLHAKDERS